ncbi:MAG: hypothetical protein R3D81_03470 [Thalassovita sp.]
MSDISIRRLRGGYCVYWTKANGKRTRYQAQARTQNGGRSRSMERLPPGKIVTRFWDTISELWEAYRAIWAT